MVELQLTADPDPSEVQDFVNRIQPTGAMDRGLTASQVLKYDSESERLIIDFDQLKRVLLEHQQYQRARGFSDSAMDILRVIEEGPDRMRFQEIKDRVNDHYEEVGRDGLEEPTIHHHLRSLREFGLVEHEHNSYTYVGP